jgi:hypothetical protein
LHVTNFAKNFGKNLTKISWFFAKKTLHRATFFNELLGPLRRSFFQRIFQRIFREFFREFFIRIFRKFSCNFLEDFWDDFLRRFFIIASERWLLHYPTRDVSMMYSSSINDELNELTHASSHTSASVPRKPRRVPRRVSSKPPSLPHWKNLMEVNEIKLLQLVCNPASCVSPDARGCTLYLTQLGGFFFRKIF